ncbi:putative RNA polymerase II subunit B1 CTD phosphatase RPAP2 homolog isoform X2 [Scaptodrosophila lebanonensis]|uniref:RNA polymerase II subunit B1 CTD phosphatase RPAP2 homolog n=1 Tax=Drosophila lebanonensis TaxID=7225 RepID=A0A6J2TPJ4_DROLE|nr:putative RNA polymerase II subunit B1 CTD phosphatase RPAP2 homolog isoform X2 [Scaptodrosophila lebanonensis]
MTTPTNGGLRDQLIAAVLKKRAAIARAQQIVVSLLEPGISDETFLDLSEIGPHNYADVIDERHVYKLCGYPLCSTVLEKIPAQKYQICAIRNKVYDLTERKKYCSGYCFRASEYIKTQIPSTPLWLRDEEPKPNFKLLPLDKK